MRCHAQWMSIVDERILEFLAENGARQPSQIADELAEQGMVYNPKYVGRRCRELADRGLIDNFGNGIYASSEKGERYLEGEIRLADGA